MTSPIHSLPGDASLVASAAAPEYITHTLNAGASPSQVPATRMQSALAGQEYPYALAATHVGPATWREVVDFMQAAGKVTYEATVRTESSLFVELKDAVGVIELEYGDHFTITFAAASRKIAEQYMDGVRTFLGEYPPYVPEPLPYNIVPVDFWMQDPHSGGAYSRRRRIEVQKWEDVASNYPAELRDDLAALMNLDNPSGGKLVLFHGPPGTGKTRAILTLMSEWREWCGPSVVTDADRLFADATYLNSIVFNSEGNGWLLLVIEDGDEFMNVNGRESKGQSIARLLNLADGIVGQGINLLTLISTNVDMDQLNPAVVRSGRCMANLHFGKFSADESTQWLASHGIEDVDIDKPMSLADLYALKAGRNPDEFMDAQATSASVPSESTSDDSDCSVEAR